jgi:hypothetical protein
MKPTQMITLLVSVLCSVSVCVYIIKIDLNEQINREIFVKVGYIIVDIVLSIIAVPGIYYLLRILESLTKNLNYTF